MLNIVVMLVLYVSWLIMLLSVSSVNFCIAHRTPDVSLTAKTVCMSFSSDCCFWSDLVNISSGWCISFDVIRQLVPDLYASVCVYASSECN